MKKTNTILILIAMLSLMGLGAVVLLFGDTDKLNNDGPVSVLDHEKLEDPEEIAEELDKNREIIVAVSEAFTNEGAAEVYTEEFQQSVRTKLDALKKDNTYTENNPLVVYNPFGTNSQSLYVYFETKEPYAVSYSIHTPEASYEDFGGNVIPDRPDTSKVHEFQITGLIPEETNMITIRLIDEIGEVKIRRFYYYNENAVAATTITLEQEQGMKEVQNEDKTFSTVPASSETVTKGLFVAFPAENELAPYLRLYDNDGVQRAELPILAFGTRKVLMLEDLLFYRVSPELFVGVNRLGEVVKFYRDENWTFGTDYCLDKENNILMIATDNRQDSVNDCVILLDRVSEKITELVDMGSLLPEYKVFTKKEDGVADWLSLTSIDLVEGNRILVAADKPNVIIKIRRLYNDPRIAFMVGDVEEFVGTSYTELFLRVDNEFELHDSVNVVRYEEYDKIRESRHYIQVLNNNEDHEYAKKEEHFAHYYRYLVDEAEFGVRLIDNVTIPAVEEDGSFQWYGDHMILTGGTKAEFYEYDKDFNLISTYIYKEPKVELTEDEQEHLEDNPPPISTVSYISVQKIDTTGYYFSEEPVLILPAEPETETQTEGEHPENE